MLSLSIPLRFLPRNIYVFDYRVLSRPLDLLAMLFNVQNIDCCMGFFNFEKKIWFQNTSGPEELPTSTQVTFDKCLDPLRPDAGEHLPDKQELSWCPHLLAVSTPSIAPWERRCGAHSWPHLPLAVSLPQGTQLLTCQVGRLLPNL